MSGRSASAASSAAPSSADRPSPWCRARASSAPRKLRRFWDSMASRGLKWSPQGPATSWLLRESRNPRSPTPCAIRRPWKRCPVSPWMNQRSARPLTSITRRSWVMRAGSNKLVVFGRGELRLGVLLENMRRECFEMAVSRPRVVVKQVDGAPHEPYEQVTVDADSNAQGDIMSALGSRGAELKDMQADGRGRIRLDYMVPSRGLIGFQT